MKNATAAVIYQGQKILIAKRAKDGLWEFPGGKIDPPETPEQCILREIKEELAVDIEIIDFLGIVEGVYREVPMKVHAFSANLIGGPAVLKVHLDLKWLELAEIERYPLVEEDGVILKRYLRH